MFFHFMDSFIFASNAIALLSHVVSLQEEVNNLINNKKGKIISQESTFQSHITFFRAITHNCKSN